MQQSGTQKFVLVLEIPNAEVFKIQDNSKQLIDRANLQLAEISEAECYIISIGTFKYTVSKEIPVLAKRIGDSGTLYIFPEVDGYIGIHLPIESINIDIFESILSDICKFARENEEITQVQQSPTEATELVKTQGELEVEKEVDPRANKKDVNYVSQYLIMAGDLAKEGISKVAVLAAGGIYHAATFISEKYIKKGPEYKVSNFTLTTLKYTRNITDKVVTFKSNQVSGALNRAGQIATKLHMKFENSNSGKKIAGTEGYKSMKDVGLAAVYTTTSIYDAMSDAMDTLSGSFNKATTDMVAKRYGERAGQAMSETLGTWENFSRVAKGVRQGVWKSVAIGIRAQQEKNKAERNARQKNLPELQAVDNQVDNQVDHQVDNHNPTQWPSLPHNEKF